MKLGPRLRGDIGGSGLIEYTFNIELPNRLDGLLVLPVLLYRWIRYGYTFRRIRLSGGKFALVDAEDFYHLSKYSWRASRDGQQFYATRSYRTKDGKKRKKLMHRQIMKVRRDVLLDHANRNGLDNRRANLRPATATQNACNRSKISSRKTVSRFKGIAACAGKKGWQARIRIEGKVRFLGYYYDEVEAAKAYDRAARKYHGDFAALNFPDAGRHRGWRFAVGVAVIVFILLLWRGPAEIGGISIRASELSREVSIPELHFRPPPFRGKEIAATQLSTVDGKSQKGREAENWRIGEWSLDSRHWFLIPNQ